MENNPLQLLRRHGRNCAAGHPIDYYSGQLEERRKSARHCTCTIWARGALNGVSRSRTTKQSDWNLARLVADAFARAGDWNAIPAVIDIAESAPPPVPPAPADPGRERKPLGEAIQEFLAGHESENSAAATIKKYRLNLKALEQFAAGQGLLYVGDWEGNRKAVRAVRNSWDVQPGTRTKKMSVLKSFFEYCVEEEYLDANPARIRAKRNRANRVGDENSRAGQKEPYTDGQLHRMLETARTLGRTELRQWPKKQNGRQVVAITEFRDYHRTITGQDLIDFINVACRTGLRILDLATFDIARLTPDNQVKLRPTKNGTWVMVPVPAWLAERMRTRAKIYGPKIFRPTGKGNDAITNNWRRPLKDLWARMGPWEAPPTPHRFRHTFVRILLDRMAVDSTVTLSMIADLAGDTEEMIRKHYSAWVPGRQAAISEVLASSFAKIPC